MIVRYPETKQPCRVRSDDAMQRYLNDIGRVPLLSAEEEIELARKIQAWQKLEVISDQLSEKLERIPNQQEWALAAGVTEPELTRTVRNGQRAKEKMIKANLRLVVSIAKKYQRPEIELLDLIQEGNLGLEQAVLKFDPSKGCRFSTYAYYRIPQAINRAVAKKLSGIKLSEQTIQKQRRIKKVHRELFQRLGRIPTRVELATAVEMPTEEIDYLMKLRQKTSSLNILVGPKKDTELGELFEDKSLSTEDRVDRNLLREKVVSNLVELMPQEQQVLSLYYGLDGEDSLSLVKISKALGISRERVGKIRKEALQKLKYCEDLRELL